MNENDGRLWVFGTHPGNIGWYVAAWIWDAKWAAHLESLGYKVRKSINKPGDALPVYPTNNTISFNVVGEFGKESK